MDIINKKPNDKNKLTKKYLSELKESVGNYLEKQKWWRVDNIPKTSSKDKREIFLLENEIKALKDSIKYIYSKLDKLVIDPGKIIF